MVFSLGYIALICSEMGAIAVHKHANFQWEVS